MYNYNKKKLKWIQPLLINILIINNKLFCEIKRREITEMDGNKENGNLIGQWSSFKSAQTFYERLQSEFRLVDLIKQRASQFIFFMKKII